MNETFPVSLIAYKLITALYRQGEISEEIYRKVSQLYFSNSRTGNPYH